MTLRSFLKMVPMNTIIKLVYDDNGKTKLIGASDAYNTLLSCTNYVLNRQVLKVVAIGAAEMQVNIF